MTFEPWAVPLFLAASSFNQWIWIKNMVSNLWTLICSLVLGWFIILSSESVVSTLLKSKLDLVWYVSFHCFILIIDPPMRLIKFVWHLRAYRQSRDTVGPTHLYGCECLRQFTLAFCFKIDHANDWRMHSFKIATPLQGLLRKIQVCTKSYQTSFKQPLTELLKFELCTTLARKSPARTITDNKQVIRVWHK